MYSHEQLPLVSIIVLNYNGKRFLQICFSSLEKLDYPKSLVEIILVDNASTDESVSYVQANFSWVRIVRNNKNLGFAGGNNEGIRHAKGDYIVLLNNDTCIEKNWLIELVKTAQSNSSIGICTSKILFYSEFITVVIRSQACNLKQSKITSDGRDLGVAIQDIRVINYKPDFNTNTDGSKIYYLEGFYNIEQSSEGSFRWSSGVAKIRLPVSDNETSLVLKLKIGTLGCHPIPSQQVSFCVDQNEIKKILLSNEGFKDYEFIIPKDVIKSSKYRVINNAGSVFFDDGYSADRGISEPDCGQYETEEEVFAACGASALYKKEMLKDIGLLDEDFFMYYEDIDLSWRAKMRGWKTYYCPASVVYHVHCGSSVEWSPFFIFYTERNRILMLIKNANIDLVVKSLYRYFIYVLLAVHKWLWNTTLGTKKKSDNLVKLRIYIILSIVRSLPVMLRKRLKVRRNNTISVGEIVSCMKKRPGLHP